MGIEVRGQGVSVTTGNTFSRTYHYTVRGTDDPTEVVVALNDGTGVTHPAAFSGLPATYSDITGEAINWTGLEVSLMDGESNIWECDAAYTAPGDNEVIGVPPTPTQNEYEIAFEVGTISKKTVQSLATIGAFDADGAIEEPLYGGGIGWNGDRFEGVDTMYQNFAFSVTHYRLYSTMTEAYVKQLCDAALHTNKNTFMGFNKGEVLYIGASGSNATDAHFAVQHKFLRSKNLSAVEVGDITGIDKKGWEYLWAVYAKQQAGEQGKKALTAKPKQVYIERLYGETNLATACDLPSTMPASGIS